MSKSTVSRVWAGIDEEVQVFRTRRLDHVAFPYVYLDATYIKARVNHRIVAASAVRAIAEVLPESVATAVIDLITGDLLAAPRRIGKPQRRELEGSWVARRGTFRVVY